jgi:uncharacterized protein (TIGR03435 family)
MTAFLLEIAIRAALVALGTAAVLTLLRIRTPAARHAAWTAVLLVMLLLPVWQAGGARVSLPVLEPAASVTGMTAGGDRAGTRDAAQPTLAKAMETAAPASTSVPGSRAETPFGWQSALIVLYLAGTFVLLVRLLLGTVAANRLRRGAAMRHGRLTSDECATPITVGWFAPSLILPDGWTRWPAAKLGAVLTHEREHARRHDPLVQWLALLNRALFWFHPLAWWLERRLSTLAEESCDAAVLAAGHSPHDYSEYLLDMARSVSAAGGRLRVVGMAMPGSGLAQRMQQIFRGLPSSRISRARLVCTVAFCAMSSVIFASGTLAERAASARAEAARASATQAGVPGSSASAMQIKFEAVSIKPCTVSGPTGGRGGNSPRISMSPGYAHWGCVTLADVIDQAWGGGSFPRNTLLNTVRLGPNDRVDVPKRVRGGPSWVEDERWEIEIRVSGDKTDLTGSAHHDWMIGAMATELRAMLEDRFQLKLRKATEQRPMYAMTAKPGFDMKVSAPEKCWNPEDYRRPPGLSRTQLPPPPPGWEGIPACGYTANGGRLRGNESLQFEHISLADFAKWLSREMDRYVLDNTNTPGRFSFRLEFAADDSTPGIIDSRQRFARAGAELLGRTPPDPVKGDGPTIFQALEKLGLKLEPTRGPAEYLQIDSVQRPKSNAPEASRR